MRIYPVSNRINFGYNKELNEDVNNRLRNAKGDKELAQTLLTQNLFIMGIEDKLRKAEKEKKKHRVNEYTNILLDYKAGVAAAIDKRFPQLNYRKNEYESYKKEIKKQHLDKVTEYYPWQVAIVDDLELDDILDKAMQTYDPKKDHDENRIAISELNAEPEVNKSKPAEQVAETGTNTEKERKKERKICRYVEEFKPTEYSPKGFKSLGGMDEIKETLSDKVIFPILNPEEAKLDEVEYGKKAPRGELFYGPPGCGKTSVIEAVSMESGVPLYKLKISKSGSIYVNGSAKNVQEAYEYVKNIAKETGKPVFLAMDEMESMTAKRDGSNTHDENNKLVGTLLQIIEEARDNNVIILGATNYYEMLDDAIKSRFDDKIYIGLPDEDTRRSVLKIHLNRRTKGQALAQNEEELDKVVKLTKGFSNRDIAILTDKAALIARADNRRDIIADDYIQPVKENQNMKVKEDLYKDKSSRLTIGFNE